MVLKVSGMSYKERTGEEDEEGKSFYFIALLILSLPALTLLLLSCTLCAESEDEEDDSPEIEQRELPHRGGVNRLRVCICVAQWAHVFLYIYVCVLLCMHIYACL